MQNKPESSHQTTASPSLADKESFTGLPTDEKKIEKKHSSKAQVFDYAEPIRKLENALIISHQEIASCYDPFLNGYIMLKRLEENGIKDSQEKIKIFARTVANLKKLLIGIIIYEDNLSCAEQLIGFLQQSETAHLENLNNLIHIYNTTKETLQGFEESFRTDIRAFVQICRALKIHSNYLNDKFAKKYFFTEKDLVLFKVFLPDSRGYPLEDLYKKCKLKARYAFDKIPSKQICIKSARDSGTIAQVSKPRVALYRENTQALFKNYQKIFIQPAPKPKKELKSDQQYPSNIKASTPTTISVSK